MKITGNRVWSKFTRNVNGTQVKLRIQELPEDKFDDVMELFMKFHTPEEPLRSVSGVSDNPVALKEFRDIMLQVMIDEKQEVLVCCIDDDDSDELKIVGASKMTLVARDAPKLTHNYNVKTSELQKFFKLRNSLYNTYNVLQEHDTEKAYFADRGLVVDPNYRCLGIAEELMIARGFMLKEHQITLYIGMATAIGSQKVATKLGAKTVRELDLAEYAKNVGLQFSGGPLTVKLMVGRVPV